MGQSVIKKIRQIDKLTAALPKDFGPGHSDFRVPSKYNRYMLRQQLESELAIEHEDGNAEPGGRADTCIATIVSGDYQWYIPLFLNRVAAEYPEYDCMVFYRGKPKIGDFEAVIPNAFLNYPRDGNTTAALRFVAGNTRLSQYKYCLITDVDVLIKREDPELHTQHLRSMYKHGPEVYDNYVQTTRAGKPRMPGVHFLTREWWDRTQAARRKHAKELKNGAADFVGYDEVMLGSIISESGLKFPRAGTLNLWAMHGIHLGTYRQQLESKKNIISTPQASDTVYMQKLLNDEQFINVLDQCAQHLPCLKAIFDVFRGIVH